MKNLLYIIAATALLTGCAGVQTKITSSQDRFTGKTINETRMNDLSMSLTDHGAMILDVREEIDEKNSAQYFLLLSSVNIGGLPLWPKPFEQSLFVVADTNQFAFAYSKQQDHQYYYPASKHQVLSICCASNVAVRVLQITGTTFDKNFNAKNRANFREFADRFLSVTNASN